MRIRDIGEFGLIDLIRKKASGSKDLSIGIGDDAAVARVPEGDELLVTMDMLVEGVHFDLEYSSPFLLGRKALAVNLSDIAAMLGRPLLCTISIGLRPDTSVEFVTSFYDGLLEMSRSFECPLAGGDTVSSPSALVIDVMVAGTVGVGRAALRSGARVGDLVLCTGSLGDSAAGLRLLRANAGQESGYGGFLTGRHLDPVPRLRESYAIASSGHVSAMMDISDGLANEVNHIARASGTGMRLWAERIPCSAQLREYAGHNQSDPLDLAIYGGEDYELLFTASEDEAARIARAVEEECGTQVSVIGQVVPPEDGVTLVKTGGSEPLQSRAFDHFRSRDSHLSE